MSYGPHTSCERGSLDVGGVSSVRLGVILNLDFAVAITHYLSRYESLVFIMHIDLCASV